jgi:hypothetical protein
MSQWTEVSLLAGKTFPNTTIRLLSSISMQGMAGHNGNGFHFAMPKSVGDGAPFPVIEHPTGKHGAERRDIGTPQGPLGPGQGQ